MAENRPPLFQAIDWLSNRNAQNQQYYKNAPPVGTGMRPDQLRYAMPMMRDSQVAPYIDESAKQFLSNYPNQLSGEEIMKQLIAANAAPANNGTMADARAQEIAYANQPQNPSGSMGAARQQEIAFANGQPNPRAGRGGGSSGQMYGPTMADMPNGGQPAYYTMDPGDGGILRTFMSPNGMPPNIPGMTATNMQSVDPNQGMLSRILRGAF